MIWQTPFRDTVVGAAVILGIVPSGLFLMITVTYSMGAVRLASQEALVQQVNAVESLSNVDVFCADKTGTLTTNRLQVAEVRAVDVSEEKLAEMIGVTQPAISMMLQRECRPQRRTIVRIAEALELDPQDLWPGFQADK